MCTCVHVYMCTCVHVYMCTCVHVAREHSAVHVTHIERRPSSRRSSSRRSCPSRARVASALLRSCPCQSAFFFKIALHVVACESSHHVLCHVPKLVALLRIFQSKTDMCTVLLVCSNFTMTTCQLQCIYLFHAHPFYFCKKDSFSVIPILYFQGTCLLIKFI